MMLSQLIEGAQEFIENGDRDIRRLGGGTLRESDHVSEKHADIIEPIGDRVFLAFEPLGDLRWKNVEEQPLGSLHSLVTLDPEVGQDERDTAAHAAQVEYEECSLGTVRQRWNRSSQRCVNQGGHGSHCNEPGQPRPSGPRPEENESAEGSQKRPHDDRTTLDIATEARLKHRGKQQDEEQYELAEPPELAAPHQSKSNQSRHHGEGTRDGPRQRTAQQGIRDGPQKASLSPLSRDEQEQSRS